MPVYPGAQCIIANARFQTAVLEEWFALNVLFNNFKSNP
jgi:hypothetical protein